MYRTNGNERDDGYNTRFTEQINTSGVLFPGGGEMSPGEWWAVRGGCGVHYFDLEELIGYPAHPD